jgi:hypothetical protein
MESTSSPSLPPQCLQIDEYSAADAARKRFAPKYRFPFFRSTPDLRAASKPNVKSGILKGKGKSSVDEDQHDNVSVDVDHVSLQSSVNGQSFEECVELPDKIALDECSIPDGFEDNDVYRWAILYENQRGYVLFYLSIQ